MAPMRLLMASAVDVMLVIVMCCVARRAGALKCACHYEDGNIPSSSASRCNSSNLCEADKGCYVKRHKDNSLSRGCADAEEFGILNRFVPPHELLNCELHEPTGDVYFRCCSTELCNEDLATDLYPTTPPPENATSPVLVITPAGISSTTARITIIVLAVVVALVVAAAIVVLLRHVLRKRRRDSLTTNLPSALTEDRLLASGDGGSYHSTPAMRGFESTTTNLDIDTGTQSYDPNSYMQGDSIFESTCGSGRPQLVKRTVGKDLFWLEKIGAGKFGEVWHCRWHGREIAVKCSNNRSESEWTRECQIYKLTMLHHSNILGFIAEDMCDRDLQTQMLILTEYHRRGSLHAVLEREELSMESFLRLVVSASDGLSHLHSSFHGSSHSKVAIAHRDIKSKNILVKENGEACICDLGLGIIYDETKVKRTRFEVKRVQVGTRRYMAPEVLTATIDNTSFPAFAAADVYSFCLVMWETAKRCNYKGAGGGAYPYSEPYKGLVGENPSYDEMKDVVILQGLRPPLPAGWGENDVMKGISRLCRMTWCENPKARMSMARVFKNLTELRVRREIREDEEDSGCCEWPQTTIADAHSLVEEHEILTESTRLDLETPEQSAGKATKPAMLVVKMTNQPTETPSSAVTAVIDASTAAEPRNNRSAVGSSGANMKYRTTEL